MSTRRTTLIATTVLAGLIFTGCSNTSSHTAATVRESDTTEVTTTTQVAVVTTTTAPVTPTTKPFAPKPTPKTVPDPTPTPAPAATLGPPPMSVPTVITLAPIDVSLLIPHILTITGTAHLSCLGAALAGYHTTISWTSLSASSVTMTKNDSIVVTGLPLNGSTQVSLGCGQSTKVVLTALWPDGSAGLSKTFIIKVDPLI